MCITFSQRPSAKELLKHRFIKNARKTPKLLERIRYVMLFFFSTLFLVKQCLTNNSSVSISHCLCVLLLVLLAERGQNLQ